MLLRRNFFLWVPVLIVGWTLCTLLAVQIWTGGHYCGAPSPAQYPGNYSLAVIIPVRDREEHLTVLSSVLTSLFNEVLIPYKLIAVEQADNRAFNRGKLLNIGFDIVKDEFDYFCFHDVDTIPAELCIDYSYPTNGVRHLAINVQKYHWKLKGMKFAGCVICITRQDFIRTNGYSNDFWGWGGEDDEFRRRTELAGIPWNQPSYAYFFSLTHGHQPRDKTFYDHNIQQLNNTHAQWKLSGLNNLEYKLLEKIQTDMYTKYMVELLPAESPLYQIRGGV